MVTLYLFGYPRPWTSYVTLPLQANYSAIAPPHSVINALDFPEPEGLANHLKGIMADEKEYFSYFWWKGRYLDDIH